MVTMTEQQAQPAPSRRAPRWIWLALALALLVGVAAAGGWFAYTSDVVNPTRGARIACQDEVTARLKAPTTAAFVDDTTITRSTDRAYVDDKLKPYVVEGHVDAENGFSAMVRTRYRCELTLEDGRWKLLDEPIIN